MSDPLHRTEVDYLGLLFSRSTQGVWTPDQGTVVSTDRSRHKECDCLKYYGGHLLAESISTRADAVWMAHVHNDFPRIIAALQAKLVLG